MSDHIIKIIPNDPFYKIPESGLQSVKQFLESRICCDFIEIESGETPVFADCCSNLESIACPECGTELDFGWWGEVMDRAYERAFTELETKVPCCGKTVSLNDLKYDFPCGFACSVIYVYNPEPPIGEEIIDAVQRFLGVDIRMIEAHL